MTHNLKVGCAECRQWVHWFLDHELGGEETTLLESHLEDCPACLRHLENQARLRDVLHDAQAPLRCPASLRSVVREQLVDTARRDRDWNWFFRFGPLALAAAAVFIAWTRTPVPGFNVDEMAAQYHARDLPMDVVAADMGGLNQLHSYFQKNLPFAVSVPNFEEERPTRLGGRITHMGDRDAALLRYELPRGRVSMFVYEQPEGGFKSRFADVQERADTSVESLQFKRVRGYTMARWMQGGLVYTVVTDLPESDVSNVIRPAVFKRYSGRAQMQFSSPLQSLPPGFRR